MTTRASQPPSQVDALLSRLDAGLSAVEDALAAELEAVKAGVADELLSAVERKRQALRALESLAADRHLITLLTSIPRQPALERVVERLRACREQNVVAGTVISSARRDNDRVLRFLGRAPELSAYNATGHTPSAARGRALGTA